MFPDISLFSTKEGHNAVMSRYCIGDSQRVCDQHQPQSTYPYILDDQQQLHDSL